MFTSDLVVRELNPKCWRLVEPLVYEGLREPFTVPARFETDFASIPRPFQWLVGRTGAHTKAAVLHDYLWKHAEVSKADADGLFRRALQELNVAFFYRWLMWAGVRWNSLSSSGFRDGIHDLPRLLLISTLPGLPVLACGVIVLLMLLAFRAVEIILWMVLWPLHQLNQIDSVAKRIKPNRIKDPTRLTPQTSSPAPV